MKKLNLRFVLKNFKKVIKHFSDMLGWLNDA